jgi:hypothetical protein
MAGQILDCVLALTEWIVRWRRRHMSPAPNGMRMMTINVFHPHHHGMTILACRIALFGHGYCAVADVQLRSMIRDSNAHGEAELIA